MTKNILLEKQPWKASGCGNRLNRTTLTNTMNGYDLLILKKKIKMAIDDRKSCHADFLSQMFVSVEASKVWIASIATGNMIGQL